jgi:hypothetical protein
MIGAYLVLFALPLAIIACSVVIFVLSRRLSKGE